MLAQLKETALSCGFTHISELDVARLNPQAAVREACAADKCKSYGKSWSCPPACGTLEECAQRIVLYRYGLLLQTVGSIEDSFDYEGIKKIEDKHSAHLLDVQQALTESGITDFLLLGSGHCSLCAQCAYPDTPCRFPDKVIISMEAMGLMVNEICTANNLPYYYGANTISFTGCVLLKTKAK